VAIQENDMIVRTDDFISTEIDNEVVLMHVVNGRYYGLNEISGHIWAKLETATKISHLIETLQSEYKGEPERIRADALRLLEKLVAKKLIKIET